MIPPRIDSVSSTRRTRMRSWRGVKLVATDAVAVGIALLLLSARTPPRGCYYKLVEIGTFGQLL